MLQQLDDTSHTFHSALQQLASQLDSGRDQLPQHVVTMVAEKCLSSKHTSHKLLQFLLKNGNFPSKYVDPLSRTSFLFCVSLSSSQYVCTSFCLFCYILYTSFQDFCLDPASVFKKN